MAWYHEIASAVGAVFRRRRMDSEMGEEMRLEAERAGKAVATARENAALYRAAESRKTEGGPSQ